MIKIEYFVKFTIFQDFWKFLLHILDFESASASKQQLHIC